MWSVRKLTVLFVLAVALCGSGTAIAFDETDLKKFKALNSCSDCDLSEVNLEKADLLEAILTRAILSGANLESAYLGEANLEGGKLIAANLEKANLKVGDLSTAQLRNATVDLAILCKTLTPWGEDNSGCEK